jgi:hypothetical protein
MKFWLKFLTYISGAAHIPLTYLVCEHEEVTNDMIAAIAMMVLDGPHYELDNMTLDRIYRRMGSHELRVLSHCVSSCELGSTWGSNDEVNGWFRVQYISRRENSRRENPRREGACSIGSCLLDMVYESLPTITRLRVTRTMMTVVSPVSQLMKVLIGLEKTTSIG